MAKLPKLTGIWSLAFHEAGHAVMAWVLGRNVIRVTITPQVEEGERGYFLLEGHAVHVSRSNRLWRSDDPLERDRAEKEAMIVIAGPLAEGLHTGKPVRAIGDDKERIKTLTKNHHGGWIFPTCDEDDDQLRDACHKKYVEWLRARVSLQLQADWPLVDALADALVKKETMTGSQVKKLLKATRKQSHVERYGHQP
jgi:ATP-dependent Zn protease